MTTNDDWPYCLKLVTPKHYDVSVEELYQEFKKRLMAELVCERTMYGHGLMQTEQFFLSDATFKEKQP